MSSFRRTQARKNDLSISANICHICRASEGRTSRLGTNAEVTVDKAMIDSDYGARASASWPDVNRGRFTSGELERGHLVARQFGGSGGNANVVPMYRVVNQTYARRIENVTAEYAREGKVVKMRVEPIYNGNPPTSSIPIAISYHVQVDDMSHTMTIRNVPTLPTPLKEKGFPQGF